MLGKKATTTSCRPTYLLIVQILLSLNHLIVGLLSTPWKIPGTRHENQIRTLRGCPLIDNDEISTSMNATLTSGCSIINKENMFRYGKVANNDILSAHVRAIGQVSAIMDLHEMGHGDLHNEIISKSLEGLILKVQKEGCVDHGVFGQIENLVKRCVECNATPTETSMTALWQLSWRVYPLSRVTLTEHLLERSMRLLIFWFKLSMTHGANPPPHEYFQDVFMLIRPNNGTITSTMWDLYELYRGSCPSRPFFESVLSALSSSSDEKWQIRQCNVLQDMIQLARNDSRSSNLQPTTSEWESALWVASQYGYAQQATWLLRMLGTTETSQRDSKQDVYTKAWFLSLCNCKSKGSFRYLERLLEETKFQCPSSPINSREYYNLVLRKFAMSKEPGSSMRARKLYDQMLAISQETAQEQMAPNDESGQLVVMAYLNEEPRNPWNVQEAHYFLQQAKRKNQLNKEIR